MRIVVQKVKQASVTVDSQIVSSIQRGLLILVGISTADTEAEVEKLSSKLLKLRIFEDETVSQFTLLAKTKKGTKPDLHLAAKGKYIQDICIIFLLKKYQKEILTKDYLFKGPQAKPLYDSFLNKLRLGLGDEHVKDGVFGAMMDVALINDGPITITLDSDE
ncbi:hypothetical protein WICMUC_000322 [Wickerhamomyces mucosus]|uniref:D-aminoacyl-tRNA deacylase n=1 Tax=Wickerhamomyces mucosus TaxID=1378264 RepID=A0A9P8TJ95_9ASCO|nr:hypothetical protein WICMUC_000322 [Wickerhamomyces mucosus]